MKKYRQYLSGAAACLLFAFTSTSSGASLQDGAGDWHIAGIFTPSALQESYYNATTGASRFSVNSQDYAKAGEELADMFFAGGFSIQAAEFTLSGLGSLSGDVTGSAVLTGSKVIKACTANGPVRLLVNASADVMALAESNAGDENEFTMLVRRPTTAATADLAGSWRVFDFGMPDDLTENYHNFVTQQGRQGGSDDHAGDNEKLVDVFFKGGFETLDVGVTMTSGGSFSGAFSGTASTTATGTVSLNPGDGVELFQLNASKNLMIRSLAEPSSFDQRFTALIKLPSSLTLSELAGPWRFARLSIPNRLVETVYNGSTTRDIDSGDNAMPGEQLVDVHFPGSFEAEQGVVGIGADGSLAAGFSGSVAVNSPGEVTITVDSQPLTFYVNDTKDVMLHVSATGDEQQIIAVLRVPLDPAKIALDTDDGKLNLLWVGQSDVKLQKSTTLTGWTDVTSSTGQSAFESSTTTAEFYRLVRESAQ